MPSDSSKASLVLTEILNKNYNPEMFYRYLESNTLKGSDLGRWNYSELAAEIERYKSLMSGEDDPVFRNTTNLDVYKSWSNSDAVIGTPKGHVEDNAKGDSPAESDEPVYELATSNKLLVSEFFKTEDVEVEIYNSTEQSYFWFMKEIFFTIRVTPMGWKVNRTFNDFVLLRDSLRRSYPFILVV